MIYCSLSSYSRNSSNAALSRVDQTQAHFLEGLEASEVLLSPPLLPLLRRLRRLPPPVRDTHDEDSSACASGDDPDDLDPLLDVLPLEEPEDVDPVSEPRDSEPLPPLPALLPLLLRDPCRRPRGAFCGACSAWRKGPMP